MTNYLFRSVYKGKKAKVTASSGGSKEGGPHGPNFLNFMQFLGKIWQICMLAPPLGGMAPLLRRILDPPLASNRFHYSCSQGAMGDIDFISEWVA